MRDGHPETTVSVICTECGQTLNNTTYWHDQKPYHPMCHSEFRQRMEEHQISQEGNNPLK